MLEESLRAKWHEREHSFLFLVQSQILLRKSGMSDLGCVRVCVCVCVCVMKATSEAAVGVTYLPNT